jgi:hypothetical protein
MWVPVDTGGNVDDGVTVELDLLSRSGQARERHGGVREHTITESCRCLKTVARLIGKM